MYPSPALTVLFLLLVTLLGVGCSSQENAKPVVYEGPLQEAQNVETFYTENEMIKVRMTAPVVNEQQNGDEEFPEGIHVEFFDDTGHLTSTLRADYAFHNKQDDVWKGQGKVEVKNIQKDEQLNTEELFWNPKTKKIYTDKFVTIRLATEIIYGTGLEADQDFSTYNVKHPQGEFELQE